VPELRKRYVETELPRFFKGTLAMLHDNVLLCNMPGVLVGLNPDRVEMDELPALEPGTILGDGEQATR
jgi:hypothetical protein